MGMFFSYLKNRGIVKTKFYRSPNHQSAPLTIPIEFRRRRRERMRRLRETSRNRSLLHNVAHPAFPPSFRGPLAPVHAYTAIPTSSVGTYDDPPPSYEEALPPPSYEECVRGARLPQYTILQELWSYGGMKGLGLCFQRNVGDIFRRRFVKKRENSLKVKRNMLIVFKFRF